MVTATDAATSPLENARANFMPVWSNAFARLVARKKKNERLGNVAWMGIDNHLPQYYYFGSIALISVKKTIQQGIPHKHFNFIFFPNRWTCAILYPRNWSMWQFWKSRSI